MSQSLDDRSQVPLHPQALFLRSPECIQWLMSLSLELIGSIASFGFDACSRRRTRRTSPYSGSLSWYWCLNSIIILSMLMLPCTWVLALLETLCSVLEQLNGVYFPRRIRGLVFSQYLLWFFTKKLAGMLLTNLAYITSTEFVRPVPSSVANSSTHLERMHESLFRALRKAPFTLFAFTSVLSAYLLFDAIKRFRNLKPSSSPDTDSDSIFSALFLVPMCAFVFGSLVLQALTASVKHCRDALP